MACTGSWMSRSVRTTAAYVIGSLPVILPSCARSPSTSLVVTDQHASACGLVARKLPGTITICCLFLLAVFMRSPWADGLAETDRLRQAGQGGNRHGAV